MLSRSKEAFRQVAPGVVKGVVKPMRILWNEIIGFLFLALAILSIPSAYRHIRDFDGEAQGFFRVVVSCAFALVMFGFGISSFLRARRISRL
jgi:hypothetical protein